ncbi:MAG: hypothetical protein VW518_00150 [Burkholderiaceae bacterium]
MLGTKLIEAAAGNASPSAYQIERSLRFNSADSAYLSRTPASAGNRKTWTWSGWVKRGGLASYQSIFTAIQNSSNATSLLFWNDDTLYYRTEIAGVENNLKTTQVFRDPSSWYHIVLVVDTTQATASDRTTLYVNGVEITAFSLTGYQSQNGDTFVNSTFAHRVGSSDGSNYFSGYLADINFIDGQALTPSSFGEINATTGVWSPIAYAGSYGTTGFYLNFSDNSGVTATTLGKDSSGNGNNWTPNNFSVTAGAGNDSLVDTPTQYGTDTGAGGEVRGNYCTLNPLAIDPAAAPTITNGNLDIASQGALATISMPTDKWYWEATCTSADADQAVGAFSTSETGQTSISGTSNPTYGFIYQANGNARQNGSVVASWATFTNGDVISFTYDASNYQLKGYKNNTLQGTITLTTPPSGASYVPMACCLGGSFSFNFGQRPFSYTAPSGFKALVTTNLPDPTVAQGDDHFNTVLYSGNDSTQSITGVGFQPDWVWVKNRSSAGQHVLTDVLRGTNKQLFSSLTNAEQTSSTGLTAFNADGFSLGANPSPTGSMNSIPDSFVAWNWKANGAGVSNTDGTITSTVSANQTAGISIVTYSGNSTLGATVGHGLGVAPSMIIVKSRSGTTNWPVYHASIGNTKAIFLNLTNATDTDNYWNNTSPTSTVFSLNASTGLNSSGATYVALVFAAIPGFSAFGSYTSNGSTDGPFVYTGFRPAWILVKRTDDTGNWGIFDSTRNTFNSAGRILYPDLSNAEADSPPRVDFLSNGFKLRTDGYPNNAATTLIYTAFAKNPFKYALAR